MRLVAANPDLLFAAPGAGDIERRLHTHQSVHFYAEGLLESKGHIT